jgi:hypothetical protein
MIRGSLGLAFDVRHFLLSLPKRAQMAKREAICFNNNETILHRRMEINSGPEEAGSVFWQCGQGQKALILAQHAPVFL